MAPGTSEQHSYHRPGSSNWIQVTEIDDEDLQFGGKSLSEWYEEERRRLSHGSSSSDEEENRGRQRVRKHHHHHHGKQPADKKH